MSITEKEKYGTPGSLHLQIGSAVTVGLRIRGRIIYRKQKNVKKKKGKTEYPRETC